MSDDERPLAVCIVAMIATFAFPLIPWFFLNAQLQNRIRAKDDEIYAASKRLEQARAGQRKYAQFQDERVRVGVELEKLRRILPPEEDQATVLRIVSNAAAVHQVRLSEIRPVRETPALPLVFAEYQVTAQGTIDHLGQFFNEIGDATRIINAPAISLRKSGSGWTATARLTAASMK